MGRQFQIALYPKGQRRTRIRCTLTKKRSGPRRPDRRRESRQRLSRRDAAQRPQRVAQRHHAAGKIPDGVVGGADGAADRGEPLRPRRRRPVQRSGVADQLDKQAQFGHRRTVLGKLLILALALWALSICAFFIGWPAVLALAAVFVPATLLAERDPERWGWLIGKKPPSNPDP